MYVPIVYSGSESGQVFDPSGVPVNLATINAGTAGQPAQQSTNPLYNYLNSFNNGTADINSMVQMATQQGAQFGLTPQDLADASKGYQWQGGLTNGSDVGSVVRDTIVRALNAKGQPQLAQQYASSPGVQNMLQQTQATMWNNINNVQHASNGGLFGGLGDILGPALAIGGLAFGLPSALDALGIGGATAGGAAALDATAAQMGLLPASTIAADTAAGLTSAGAGLGSLGFGSAATSGGNMGLLDSISNFFSDPVSSIGNLFSGGNTSAADFMSTDAQQLAQQGFSQSQISQILGQSYGLDPTAASQLASTALSAGGNTSNILSVAKNLLGGSGSSLGGIGSLGLSALGALLGSSNGAQQAGTTTVTQAPWAGQQPYLLSMFGQAANAAQNGATPNSYQNNAANTLNSVTTSGPTSNPYLGVDNPYLTKAIQAAQNDFVSGFQPVLDQAQQQNGDFGNTGIAETYGKQLRTGLSNIDTNMRMQDYTNQQNLYANAVNQTASNANNLASVGSYLQQMPWNNVLNYGKAVGGASYGSTTNTPYYTNPGAGAVGGAIAGSQIAKNLGL